MRESDQPKKKRANQRAQRDDKRPEVSPQPSTATIADAIPRRPVAPEPTARPQPSPAGCARTGQALETVRPASGVRLRVGDRFRRSRRVRPADGDDGHEFASTRPGWRFHDELVGAADERRGVPAVRAAIALASIIAALCINAAPAGAGTYDVWSCRLPDGSVAPLDGWQYEGTGTGANQCPQFGFSAAFPTSPVAATATAGWTFEAPQNLSIYAYELYRSARAGVGSDGAHRAYALYHDAPLFEPLVHLWEFCIPSNNCYEQGRPFPGDPMAVDNRVARSDLNLKNLILRMECKKWTGEALDCGPAEPGGALGIARARISLSDAIPPSLDPPSGSIVTEGAEVEGIQAVQVSAHDEGGGILRFSVLVDGSSAMEETLEDVAPSCRSPFVKVVPCARSTTRTIAFDTTTIPNGKHSIQIAVDDAAGNRTISPAVSITTANGSIPNGSGASGSAQLVARFVTRGGSVGRGRATVDFNETKAIQGRLVDTEGRPIGFAKLDVMAQAPNELAGKLVRRAWSRRVPTGGFATSRVVAVRREPFASNTARSPWTATHRGSCLSHFAFGRVSALASYRVARHVAARSASQGDCSAGRGARVCR